LKVSDICFYLLALISLSALMSCHENQPEYTLLKPESGDRVVVVEEFSGARCPNCPQGTQQLEDLKSLYGDQLIIVTIHAGDFAFKYDESSFDFTTSEGNVLLQMLGNPIGYPSAVINRVKDPSTGFGFFLAIVAIASIREKLRYSNIPAPLRGLGIAFIVTGLMGMAFMSFAGISL
jgi:thiol-disulfide isomerase/thioredoxin